MSKNIKSKLARCFICLTLALSMLVSVVPVHAAGIEDWGSSEGPEENIRVYNNNLTPVKTIKKSGKLTIHFITLPCKPGYTHCGCRDINDKIKVTKKGKIKITKNGYFFDTKIIV